MIIIPHLPRANGSKSAARRAQALLRVHSAPDPRRDRLRQSLSAPMEGLHTEVVSTIREEGPEDRPGATTDARGVLRDLLNGRLIVTPTLIEGARWFEFKGEATFGALLRGLWPV